MLITSLLDNDLYKFTMMQFAFCYYPHSEVEYQLFYRDAKTQLRGDIAYLLEKEIQEVAQLRFKDEELVFLKKLGLFSSEFLQYLSSFSLSKEAINLQTNGPFKLIIKGKWTEVILWEVILLALVSELNTQGKNTSQGEKNLIEKVSLLKKETTPISFIEFGTRRRFSRDWQEKVNLYLIEHLPSHFLGTSNVKLAMDLGIQCYGTMGHELLQAGQAISPHLENFQIQMLESWFELYKEPLSIALTDVLSLPSFLYDFKGKLAQKYIGLRVDSGDPFQTGDKIIQFYQEEGIDPLSKKLIFSDSLTFTKAIQLAARFQHKIQVAFGIGTYLTHDLGFAPSNLVIKMTAFNGQAVGKLTDTPAKSYCLDPLFLKRLRGLDHLKQHASRVERDVLLMDRAIVKIRDRFGLEVTLKDLTERATIRNLAKFVEGDLLFIAISKKLRAEDLSFFSSWSPPELTAPVKSSTAQSVLLTGATGFLGSHMLSELHNATDAIIYVLIRAKNCVEALSQLKNTFQKYALPDLTDSKRVIPVVGNLTQNSLGLSEEEFKKLACSLDAIYHAGSFVHHVYDYQTLRSANVKGTQELIKLAMSDKKKRFYYVSSIVAAVERDEEGWIKEAFPQEEDCGELDGYSQTKWVSEKLLAKAAKRGLPLLIFRPSNILGREKDGIASPEKDHMLNLIKGCIQMGLAPDWKLELNFVPVDFVSRFIIKASLHFSEKGGQLFHIVNNHKLPWLQLIDWLNQFGYRIEVIPEEEWCEKHLPSLTNDNALFPLVNLYANGKESPELYAWTLQLPTGAKESYRDENGKELFQAGAPPITPRLLQVYFDYLQKCGFLEQPSRSLAAFDDATE